VTGETLRRGGDFSNETDPPAGDSVSEGRDSSEGETLFRDTGSLGGLVSLSAR